MRAGDRKTFSYHRMGFHRTGGVISPVPAIVCEATAEGQESPLERPGQLLALLQLQCRPSAQPGSVSSWLCTGAAALKAAAALKLQAEALGGQGKRASSPEPS